MMHTTSRRPGAGGKTAWLLASVSLLAAGCSESKQATPPLIDSSTTAVTAGATVQITTTTPDETVLWGLTETTPPAVTGWTFPLKASADGRYLVDQTERPWRVQADAGWLMSSEATQTEVQQYLDARQAQGFNSFYLMAMVHPGGYPEATHAPNDRNGDPPFATPGDMSSAGASPASERYWAWIDWIIAEAAKRNIVVMLAYTYLGFGGGDQGWWETINRQANRDVLANWGRWLGNRFKDDPNIIWFGLGDYTPPAGSEGALRVRAIADGIKQAGATQPFMGEADSPDSLPTDSPEFAGVLNMNSFYGYGPNGKGAVYVTADRAYRMSPPIPAWMEEGTYEFENYSGGFSGESWETRRGRFWSVLGGGTAGDGFGSHEAWHWLNIPTSLTTPGTLASVAAFQLFATMPWWELQPSGTTAGFAGHDLVTKGQGTWGDLDYVTSARTSDGAWLLAYVPVTKTGSRTVTVDLAAMSGTSRAQWWDPTTGAYIAIAGGDALANTGTRDFTTPGKRGDGTDDWLLVLDASRTAPCGTITTAGTYTAPIQPPADTTCAITASLASDPGVVTTKLLHFAG